MIDLDELERQARASIGGPWTFAIAFVRTAVPELIAELRALRARLAESEAGAAAMRAFVQRQVDEDMVRYPNDWLHMPATGRTTLAVIEAAERYYDAAAGPFRSDGHSHQLGLALDAWKREVGR